MNRRKQKSSLHNWTNTGSFVNRPANGWIHPTEQLGADAGVTYSVKFLGSIVVLESMKSLDFNTRTAVAKECIYRICSVIYPKAAFNKKFKQPNCLFFTQRSVAGEYLAESPDLQFSQIDVNFTVTSDSLSVIREDNGNLLYHHRMQTVSFASGGDGDLIDFVAYIAKDDDGRKCHVMECVGGLANDVITTIGQAFELRFKQHLSEKPSPFTVPDRTEVSAVPLNQDSVRLDSPNQSEGVASSGWATPTLPPYQSPRPYRPVPFGDSPGKSTVFDFGDTSAGFDSPLLRNRNIPVEHVRVGSAIYTKPYKPTTSRVEMPESDSTDDAGVRVMSPRLASSAGNLPYDEPWFHGKISRQESEKRLLRNGEFLVRESPTSSGQFVLSGRHDGDTKHLLLVDPEGRVRTKDQLFMSVSHLINYHLYNGVPIVAVDVELLLIVPVKRLDFPA